MKEQIEDIRDALLGLMEIVHQICPPVLQGDVEALMDEWAGEENTKNEKS